MADRPKNGGYVKDNRKEETKGSKVSATKRLKTSVQPKPHGYDRMNP